MRKPFETACRPFLFANGKFVLLAFIFCVRNMQFKKLVGKPKTQLIIKFGTLARKAP